MTTLSAIGLQPSYLQAVEPQAPLTKTRPEDAAISPRDVKPVETSPGSDRLRLTI